MAQRYFTLQEANDLVPWLREVWESLAPLQKKLDDLDKEVASLQSRIHVNGGRETENELDLKQRALKEAAESIQRHIQAIHERGIMVRSVKQGLVDFPSMQDGREVYLCWIMGEPDVRFWHDVNAGFAGRQPL
jgi:hypothetical protein